MMKPGMSDEALIVSFVLFMIFGAWSLRDVWLPVWKRWREK